MRTSVATAVCVGDCRHQYTNIQEFTRRHLGSVTVQGQESESPVPAWTFGASTLIYWKLDDYFFLHKFVSSDITQTSFTPHLDKVQTSTPSFTTNGWTCTLSLIDWDLIMKINSLIIKKKLKTLTIAYRNEDEAVWLLVDPMPLCV